MVFDNWSTIDKLPRDDKKQLIPRLLGYGLDFGYSADPTALVAVYRMDGEIIFDEVIYQTKLLNSDIINIMKSKGIRKQPIYADAAEPKSIKEIRLGGFYAKAADKGRDSINYGINLLQQEHFKVTSTSLNLIKELRSHAWDKDKMGEQLPKPVDANNHAIDAMRYWAMMSLKTSRGKYDIR